MRTGGAGRGVRWLLVLHLAALSAALGAVLVAAGLPLAARGALGPGALLALAAASAVLLLALGAALLFRAVARPVERILRTAATLREDVGLGLLGPPEDRGGVALGRAALAFERLARALVEERSRLAAKVTELQRANEALAGARASLLRSERLATVGQLAAGIAHEVGNPLGAIAGYADVARDRLASGRPAEAADCVERIAGEVLRIDRTVRDLLDFARPLEPALSPVRAADALETALRLARVQPRFRAVSVDVDLASDLPEVLADPHRLSQVFLNLLLNAGDAMGGAGHLRITGTAGREGVALVFADDGPGIAPAHLARIFDPFFSTKPPGQGTGLGLAVCHGIMESFGGEITAENRDGSGAVFRLRFLRAPTKAPFEGR